MSGLMVMILLIVILVGMKDQEQYIAMIIDLNPTFGTTTRNGCKKADLLQIAQKR
jgi:uncharacterized membrane protein (GlpM family)